MNAPIASQDLHNFREKTVLTVNTVFYEYFAYLVKLKVHSLTLTLITLIAAHTHYLILQVSCPSAISRAGTSLKFSRLIAMTEMKLMSCGLGQKARDDHSSPTTAAIAMLGTEISPSYVITTDG